MTTPYEEISRAAQARQITDHPLWNEAYAALETRYLQEWRNSPARDTQGRELLWTLVKTLSVVKGHFEEILTTGKLAELQLQEQTDEE